MSLAWSVGDCSPTPAGVAVGTALDADAAADQRIADALAAMLTVLNQISAELASPPSTRTNPHGVLVTTKAIGLVQANGDRRSVVVQNLGAVAIYIGDTDAVTAASGQPNSGLSIPGGGSLSFTPQDKFIGPLYAILDPSGGSGSADVRVMELI